jgi:hypothetical protein
MGFSKRHPPQGKFNGAQRIAYTGVILMGAGSLLTGLAIYKPTQLHVITALLGGYDALGVVLVSTQSHEPRTRKRRFETNTRAKSSFRRRIPADGGTHPRAVSNDVHRGNVHGTSG